MRTPQIVVAGPVLACLLGGVGCQSGPESAARMPRRLDPSATVGEPVNIVDTTEVDLVERMAYHRQNYIQHLRALVTYYTDNAFPDKARWAQRELDSALKVHMYYYVADADVPDEALRPAESIAEADELFADGRNYMKQGGHGVPMIHNKETMRLALAKFKQLVREYPRSDKIDDAAFYIGEISKEYFDDNRAAVQWYQRAWTWDPQTPHAARFQAAVVYDFRLHHRARALELYQQVLEHETFNKSNVRFASARIKELTDETSPRAPEPPAPVPATQPE